MKRMVVVTLALLILLGVMPLAAQAASTEELALLNLINNYRAQNGIAKLALSPKLTQAAYGHSYDMATKNYFSHTSLSGATFVSRIRATGYTYNTYLGENIAAGYAKALSVFNAWKASSGHNRNMLNRNFKAVGISGVYNANSRYKWYWTCDFGGVVDR